jgi:hypothetical protein
VDPLKLFGSSEYTNPGGASTDLIQELSTRFSAGSLVSTYTASSSNFQMIDVQASSVGDCRVGELQKEVCDPTAAELPGDMSPVKSVELPT